MKFQFYFLFYADDILVVCFQKSFNIYFHEQMFFQTFVAKGDPGQFFLRNNNV